MLAGFLGGASVGTETNPAALQGAFSAYTLGRRRKCGILGNTGGQTVARPPAETVHNAGSGSICGIGETSREEEPEAELRGELARLRQRVADLEEELAFHQEAVPASREREAKYRRMFEHAAEGIFQTSPEGRYLSMNPAFVRMFGYSSEEDMKAAVSDVGSQIYVHPDARPQVTELLAETGRVEGFETQVYRRDGSTMWVSCNVRLVRDATGAPSYHEGTVQEITRRKEAELMLRQREQELEAKSLELEEINTALRVLLKRREEDQKEFGAIILANLKELVFPYLEKLAKSSLDELQRTYLKVLTAHLEALRAPFLRDLGRVSASLSRTERQIAVLIKDGLRNKEITALLGISVNTVLTHRYHLRTKLGLKQKKVNLVSYLKSIGHLQFPN